MSEAFLNPEANKIEKQQVIDLYKKIIEKGATNPDDFDLNDPAVIEANEKYVQYFDQKREGAKGDTEAELQLGLEQTLFYVDAGFTDPVYVDEMIDLARHDWEANKEEHPAVAEQMKTTIKKYITQFLPDIDPEIAFTEKEER